MDYDPWFVVEDQFEDIIGYVWDYLEWWLPLEIVEHIFGYLDLVDWEYLNGWNNLYIPYLL